MSKHEYARMYISAIHPMLRMMIDQRLAVLFPNQNPAEPFPVEEVRKAAKYALESYRSPYVNPAPVFSPYTGIEQQAPAPAPQYAWPPAVAPLPPYRQQQMMMPGGSISDMIDQLSKATAAGPPLAYYNPYGFPLVLSSAASSGSASCSAADDRATSRSHSENGVFNGRTAPGCDSEAG